MPLINCEVNLILIWSENCVLTSKATRDADPNADPAVAAIDNPTNATFKITDKVVRSGIYFINWKWENNFRIIKNRI